MPGGDRTGPAGMGPMTGRAAGFCAGYDQPGLAGRGWGRGMGCGAGRGMGRGSGRGLGNGRGRGLGRNSGMAFWGGSVPPAAPVDEKQVLQTRAEALQAQLDAVQQRLESLDKE